MESIAVGKKVRSSGGDMIFNFFLYLFAVVIILITIYPLYFIVIASISNPSLVASGNVWFLPTGLNIDGYKELAKRTDFWMGYRNTIAYAGAGTLIALVVNIPAAYALSRRDLVGRGVIQIYFLITMFFNGGLIPTFMTIQNFGLYDTFWVIVLPFSVSVYNMVVARTFFNSSLPADLLDAAQIDGCGNLRFFVQIALPLSKAVLAVIALWTAVGHWNQYFNSLIYTRDPNLLPLQLILRNILIINQQQESLLGSGEAQSEAIRIGMLLRFVCIIVSTLPIMCVYPFLQKYFNQGVMIGAIKG